jgi:hypothetical protein
MPAEFRTEIDIANRACQHTGQPRIGAAGFLEISKQAREIGFVYGKLRRAELQENNWVFAIRHTALRSVDVNTMLLAVNLWSASSTYYVGSITADGNGNLWISNQPNNLGNEPHVSAAWDAYFGPMTASLYDATTTYWAGELVYTAAGDGTSRVYLSLQNANGDNPATATAWSATATYAKNATITRSSIVYQSLIDLNINNDPAAAPALWDSGTSYLTGNLVGGSDDIIYSAVGPNVGIDPTTDTGGSWTNTGVLNPWTSVFVGGRGSIKWLQVGGAEFPAGMTLSTLNIIYPLSPGPSSDSASRNVYRLPAGFLRKAPQDPKAGSMSWLGAPSGRQYEDWNIEGNYLVTSTGVTQNLGVIILRFVADVTDVTAMNDMFCEGLGARIGLEVCEPLTQSTEKKGGIAQAYARFMGNAKLTNAIEAGAVEPDLDDYIACRA